MEILGYTKCLIKCDQESSPKNVVDHVKAHLNREVEHWRPDRLEVESNPAYESQSYGSVGRADQAVGGQVRTPKPALVARIGKKLMPYDCVMPWMIITTFVMHYHLLRIHGGLSGGNAVSLHSSWRSVK